MGRMPRGVVGLAAIMLVCVQASGQTAVDESRRNALTRAIERVAPAVVTVNIVVPQRPPGIGLDFWDFFYRPSPRIRAVESAGSGFIFDGDGHVLTNYHVVEHSDRVHSVTLPDGRQLEAEYIGGDSRTDLAVLKVEGSGLPYARLGDSDSLALGEWSIAIGNPFGGLIQDPVPSVSVGVVSATKRRLSPSVGSGERLYQNMIQTDAAINPGNSGGPLVSANAEVIGVNTMIFSKSGGSEGLGFAIPINRARRVAQEIIEFGRRRDPWPGFRVQASGRSIGPFDPDLPEGCVVVEILRRSPAYKEGLRPGDLILTVNGEDVSHPMEIDFIIWDLFIGDSLTLEVMNSQRRERTLRIKLEELSR